MTLEQVRELYCAKPFHPFILHQADGRSLDVKSPEFVLLPPTGRTIAVYVPDAVRIVDLLLVTEVEVSSDNGTPRRPGQSSVDKPMW